MRLGVGKSEEGRVGMDASGLKRKFESALLRFWTGVFGALPRCNQRGGQEEQGREGGEEKNEY